MAQATDVVIAGAGYMLAPGGYKRSQESGVRSQEPGRINLDRFGGGLGVVDQDRPVGAGWAGLTVHGAYLGAGLEPWPNIASHADGELVANPTATARTPALIAGTNAYFAIGTRLYKTVALTNGTWADVTLATTVTDPITDLAYYEDDVLILQGSASDIRRYNTATGATSSWRAGERGTVGVGYQASLVYARLAANDQETLSLGIERADGTAVTRFRWLDSPIVRMGLFAGKVAIATKSSLYLLGGQPIKGADTPTTLWEGDPEPLFTHGQWVNAAAGDFGFLLGFGGKLYTWLAGSVVEYDPSLGREGWRPVGPRGVASRGACIAGGFLLVALETVAPRSQVWAFDGMGWWRIIDLTTSAPRCWPLALGGAGDRDALVFLATLATYQLFRLAPRSASLHTYPVAGEWISSLLHGGFPDKAKRWRQVGAVFSAPEVPGNPASADNVTVALDYSTDLGATWTAVDSEVVGVGRTVTLAGEVPAAPASRFLQARVVWSSVVDWAPVLTQVWVDYVVLENAPRRRRWELKVSARDGQVKREGGVQATTGRQQVAALWAAWAAGATVAYRDVDYDADPTERTVRILAIAEETPKPSDQGRWGDAVLALALAEV